MIRLMLPFLFLSLLVADEKQPPPIFEDWTKAVPGHVMPASGEHPRLFFRVSDLPRLRQRAATAEGQAILQRLRRILDGGEGTTFPKPRSAPTSESDAEDDEPQIGSYYTLWHGAGYGLLYQITGEQRYADLGKQAVQVAISRGKADADSRYSFTKATGALRCGPALSAVAMAYDMCYSGWDESFRDQIRKELEFYDPSKELGPAKPANCRIEDLARGSKHTPRSNHWGPQIGGAAIALWAIAGDPGVDQARIEKLLAVNKQCQLRQLGDGLGDHGYFSEHLGASQITTDTAFTLGLLAWKVTGGVDFVADHTEVPWISLRWPMLLVPTPRGPEYMTPIRGSTYGGQRFWRDGLSRGGQFVQGFPLMSKEDQAAMLWTYSNILEPAEKDLPARFALEAKQRSYDLLSPYAHRAIIALAYWPWDLAPQNPATRLPKTITDQRMQWHVFRNRWQDADDLLVGVLLGAIDTSYFGDLRRLRIWGLGRRYCAIFPPPTVAATKHAYGSNAWTLAWPGASLYVDLAPGQGLEGVVITRGLPVTPDKREFQIGAPSKFDPVGEWVFSYGDIKQRCVQQDGKYLLYDSSRRDGQVQGKSVTLNMGDKSMQGTVSPDFLTITWKQGKPWKRELPKHVPQPGEEENVAQKTFTDLSGSWKTEVGRSGEIIKLRQTGERLEIVVDPLGELRLKGTQQIVRVTYGTKTSLTEGMISACGDLIEWRDGAFDWRRAGSPALTPAPWGGADDQRSRMSRGTLSGQEVVVITFSSEGKHPSISIKDTQVQIGSRVYRLEQERLIPVP